MRNTQLKLVRNHKRKLTTRWDVTQQCIVKTNRDRAVRCLCLGIFLCIYRIYHNSTTLVIPFPDMTQSGGVEGLAQWSQTTLETSEHLKPQNQTLEGLTWPFNDVILSALLIHLAFPSFCNGEAGGFGHSQAIPGSKERSFVI